LDQPDEARAARVGKLGFIQEAHDEERRSGVEPMAVAHETAASAAGLPVFLEDSDMQAGLGEVCRGGDASDARADHEHRSLVHGRPSRGEGMGPNGRRGLWGSIIHVRTCQLIRDPVARLLPSAYRGRSLKSSLSSVSISHSNRAI
jgi:hypothetical protein